MIVHLQINSIIQKPLISFTNFLYIKEQLQNSYQHTNYAVVDADLIHHIYHMMYAEKGKWE